MIFKQQTTFIDAIRANAKRPLIFAADVLSQPHRELYLKSDPYAHTKCNRALGMSEDIDAVLLVAPVNQDYIAWLKSNKLAPKVIFSFNLEQTDKSLGELILENPDTVRAALGDILSQKPIYVPHYSSKTDLRVAELLGAELFGSDEDVAMKYFDKKSFKEELQSLGITTVGGITHGLQGSLPNPGELAEIMERLLHSYPSLMVRGARGSSGSSAYHVDGEKVHEVIETLQANRDEEILIEPFLSVIASPNDQWIIDLNGDIHHVGLSAQLFEELKHVGNIQGQLFSKRVSDEIYETSRKIVTRMKEEGYQGLLGIDYIVTDQGIFAIENNARMNGSSYAFGVVDRLSRTFDTELCWKFYKAHSPVNSFDELTQLLNPILYDGKSTNCVFPFDCDRLSATGIFAPILIAEDTYHLHYLEQTLDALNIQKV